MTVETRGSETNHALDMRTAKVVPELVPGIKAALKPLRKNGQKYKMAISRRGEYMRVKLIGPAGHMDAAEEVLHAVSAENNLPKGDTEKLTVFNRVKERVQRVIVRFS